MSELAAHYNNNKHVLIRYIRYYYYLLHFSIQHVHRISAFLASIYTIRTEYYFIHV